MSFLLYISFFCMPEYLTDKRLLHADVGPVPEAAAADAGGVAVAGNLPFGEAERVLRRVEYFTALTRIVPMVEIEDLLPSMQPHVVGAPRTWVRLFRHLAHAVDDYNRVHRP
jgi:hypothetical protein